jgi:ribosomal protein S18 acetylase RimI-like enzyme
MPVEIRMLTIDDAALLGRVVGRIADGVFDNPTDPKLTAEFLSDPRHSICAAVDGGTIVGFASGVRYVHPDKPSELWINEVAVAPTHQRRGLAKAILAELLAFARSEGCTEAWVLTDEVNKPARALYASAGGTESLGVVMVTFPL